MKRFEILAVFSLLSFTAFAQNTPTVSTKIRRFSLSVHFSPDYCFRTLQNNDGSPTSNEIVSSRNGIEVPKIGYTAGLGLQCLIKEKFAIELGIHYSNKGYQTTYYEINYITPSGQPDPALPKRFKQVYNFSCIDFPLTANFRFGKKRSSIIASAGVVTNIILYERVQNIKDFGDGNVKKEKSASNFIYNPINFSPMVSIGYQLRLGCRSDLKLSPTFRYGVLQIISAPVSARLWNAGLDIGWYITL